MGQIAYSTVADRTPLHQRVLARLQAQVSWEDENSNEKFSILGTTENVGETTALVNLDILPHVGSSVKIRLMDENTTIIETSAEVIRVERDPGKPQAALNIVENLKKWKDTAITAAQDWVTRDTKLNYEDDGWLN
ncbi:MAG: hypothetical protein ACR2J3_07180 [Aridibacter sp.]